MSIRRQKLSGADNSTLKINGGMHDHLFIRYELDPYKIDAFRQYAKVWGEAIPRCGADLIGYYAPHEGSLTAAYGVYNIENLAAYEQYRQRLAQDARGRENYAFAQREKFILREERMFLKIASV